MTSTGGTFMAVDCGSSLEIEDESALGVYHSPEWGDRCLCKTCGSTLFWRLRPGAHDVVAAQAFDDPGQFPFASEIFADDKPGNHAFANHTQKMTGAEFLASSAPPG
jgi:hypothetical protein